MSLKDELIQHKANMTNIMSKYTEDILVYISKHITTVIKNYMDNYKVCSSYKIGNSNKLSIKFLIDGDNHIHIMKIADNITENNNLYKITKNFNFRTFKYNTNMKINLLKINLENYIQHFMPHWNQCIREHSIVVCKDTAKSYYHLEILFDIGIKTNDDIIVMRHNDHMNKVYYDYLMNELNSAVKDIIERINKKIKNNIVSDNKHYINIIEYLGEERTFRDILSENPVPCNHISFNQKHMINILKLYDVPTSFKLIDYIYRIIIFIKYIYTEIEKYYNGMNMSIVRIPNRPDIMRIDRDMVHFDMFCIEL